MDKFERAAEAIMDAEFLLITAGAGMGVDSGLPDFRGNEGFWRAYPALRGYSFAEMANPAWFERNPRRAWGFYGHRLHLYRSTKPHQGFDLLRQWGQNKQSFVFTSNVDGQFQKAGFAETQILECHGSIHWLQSIRPNKSSQIWSADPYDVDVDEEEVKAMGSLPIDPQSGELARPNVLMFGDWSWLSNRCDEQEMRYTAFLKAALASNRPWTVIEMGAGKTVPTVRMQSERCMQLGATLIRINPRECDGPTGIIDLKKTALSALLLINDRIRGSF